MAKVKLSQRAQRSGGQPITQLMSKALANPDLISLAAGFVDQTTLPISATRQAFDSIHQSDLAAQSALQYGLNLGLAPLREAILQDFLAAEGMTAAELNLSIDQVVITAGSNQLLHLVFETLLDPGDIVLCCAPTYFVVLGTLAGIGGRAIGVKTDDDGICPSSLQEAMLAIERAGELNRLKAVYVVSYFDNPTGRTFSTERRQAVLEIVQQWISRQPIHIVEDAAYRQLRYEGEDVSSIRSFDPDGQRVIYAGTFSKSFSPGVRVGWGFLPKYLVQPVADQKGNIDFGSPNLNQYIMAEVLDRQQHHPHIQTLRSTYSRKRDAMLSAMDRHLQSIEGVRWIRPHGGLYVWLELPTGMDAGMDGALFTRALDEGMIYVPGEFCFPTEGEPVKKNSIRLSFGVQSPEGIERGIAALGRAIRSLA